MKKWLIIGATLGSTFVLPMLIVFLVLIMAQEQTVEPVPLFATEDKAEEYQYVGSELGIPWEITILADGILAEQKKESGIEKSNPLLTGLEFCKLVELKYEKIIVEEEEGKTKEKWELVDTKLYTACDQILQYIGADRADFTYKEASALVTELQQTAKKKEDSLTKYEITLLENTDYKVVLMDYIGLTQMYAESVIELYDAHYLAYKYGYMSELDDDILTDAGENSDIPVITGDVTRDELARVAASLMNWPYLLGGKSSAKGKPRGPLDCSGYIDWVYIQCFGAGVSAGGGKLPAGVAVSGTAIQFYATDPIDEAELRVGDLGFLKRPEEVAAGAYNHIGIYVGEINGQAAWIHCGGSSFGYESRPKGRVGISTSRGSNSINNILGGTFTPAMKGCNFRYYRRARFIFKDDIVTEEGRRTACIWDGLKKAA